MKDHAQDVGEGIDAAVGWPGTGAGGGAPPYEGGPPKVPGGRGQGASGDPEFAADQIFVLSQVLGCGDEERAQMAIAGGFD